MSSWRAVVVGLAALLLAASLIALWTSPLLVLPPLAAAVAVLAGAAFAVDYFGLARRGGTWNGPDPDRAAAARRARRLARRFSRQRRDGSVRAPATARALLVALAASDRIEDAGDVIDFLAADALGRRPGADLVGDALRAIALAGQGRIDEARVLTEALGARQPRHPLVVYARARVAELARQPHEALAHIETLLPPRAPLSNGALRELAVVRARLLAATARGEAATGALRELIAAGGRREVEALATAPIPALAIAARAALTAAAPYR